MKVAKEDVDLRIQVPGATLRQRRNFGSASGYDGISGEYFSLSAAGSTRRHCSRDFRAISARPRIGAMS